jgi:hypothetical protein
MLLCPSLPLSTQYNILDNACNSLRKTVNKLSHSSSSSSSSTIVFVFVVVVVV